MVLNIQGGALSRNSLSEVVLDLLELRDGLSIQPSSRFYNILNWKSVTITYRSHLNDFQTKELIFNIVHPQTQTSISDKLEQYFIGNPVISSVTIYDNENGKDKYSQYIEDLIFLNIEGVLETAPSSIFFESTNGISGKIPVNEIPLWLEGWKVRIYDIVNQKYMDPAVDIVSLDGTSGLVTLSSAISVEPNIMVLKAPNNNKFEVIVDNSGNLSTVLTSLEESIRFNTQEQRTGNKWVIQVDNAGSLFIEPAVGDDQDLTTSNDYLLNSPNGNGWKLLIVPVAHIQTIPGAIPTSRLIRQATNGQKYELTVGNDGLFTSVPVGSGEVLTSQFAIKDPVTQDTYALRTDIDGEFYLIPNQDNLAVNAGFLLAAPNGTPYNLKSSMVVQPEMVNSIQIKTMVLQSPNGTNFKVTVSNTGVLSTEDDNLSIPTPLFNFTQITSGTKVMLKVDDNGVLYIDSSLSSEELLLETNDNYLLKSPDGTSWKPAYTSGNDLQMVSDLIIRTLVLQAPDGNKYDITVNDNGFLIPTLNNALTATAGFRFTYNAQNYVIKITNDKRIYVAIATGGVELAYPINNSFHLISPDLKVWTVSALLMPQLQSVTYAGVQTMVLASPNSSKYQVLVDNAGNLSTNLNNSLTVTPRFNILQSEFNDRYTIKVTDDGVLYLEISQGADLDLPTNNNYQLASPNSTAWRLNVISITELHTELAPTTLVNMAMRFAYSDEVTLDQLSRFKFD